MDVRQRGAGLGATRQLISPPAGEVWRKYYFAGSARIAMREVKDGGAGDTLSYLLSDHLGSLSEVVTGASVSAVQRYAAWGETRDTLGSPPTQFQFTGQYNEEDLGIYYFGARWFDPRLGRWLSPDSIIPDPSNSPDWDRYAYTNNNPVNATDSSGHCIDGLTTVPCLIALIAVAGFAGGAANYEFNVSGNSWWESKEDAVATLQAGVDGALLAVGAAITAGQAALIAPDAAMYIGSKTGNVPTYLWGATQNGLYNSVGDPYPVYSDPRTGKPIPPPPSNLKKVPNVQRVNWGPESKDSYMDEYFERGYTLSGKYTDYQIHHITPREYGGTNDFDNLVPVSIPSHKEFNNWWRNYGAKSK